MLRVVVAGGSLGRLFNAIALRSLSPTSTVPRRTSHGLTFITLSPSPMSPVPPEARPGSPP
jgi:hypothetical protein